MNRVMQQLSQARDNRQQPSHGAQHGNSATGRASDRPRRHNKGPDRGPCSWLTYAWLLSSVRSPNVWLCTPRPAASSVTLTSSSRTPFVSSMRPQLPPPWSPPPCPAGPGCYLVSTMTLSSSRDSWILMPVERKKSSASFVHRSSTIFIGLRNCERGMTSTLWPPP